MTLHSTNHPPLIYRFQISHFEVAVLFLLNKRLTPAKPPSPQPPSPPPFNRRSHASGAAASASEDCDTSSGATDPTAAAAAAAATAEAAVRVDATDSHASSEPADDGAVVVVKDPEIKTQ